LASPRPKVVLQSDSPPLIFWYLRSANDFVLDFTMKPHSEFATEASLRVREPLLADFIVPRSFTPRRRRRRGWLLTFTSRRPRGWLLSQRATATGWFTLSARLPMAQFKNLWSDYDTRSSVSSRFQRFTALAIYRYDLSR
jgi:hypothetical protein